MSLNPIRIKLINKKNYAYPVETYLDNHTIYLGEGRQYESYQTNAISYENKLHPNDFATQNFDQTTYNGKNSVLCNIL